MQRGFITIPVLILILLGTAIVGGTGYVAYNAGKSSTEVISVAENNPELNSSSTVLLKNNSATSSEVASDSNVESSVSEDATQKIANLESEISDLKNQVVGNETVKTVSHVSAVENTMVQEEILNEKPEVDTTLKTEEVFDWTYWISQIEEQKQTKKGLNDLLDSKERTIQMYEDSKDSYAKWSPMLKDTIAGDLASEGYSQLSEAISLEESAIEIGEEYKDSINQVLDAIEKRDQIILEGAVSLQNQKFEDFKDINEKAQVAAKTANQNIEDFHDALESMGY